MSGLHVTVLEATALGFVLLAGWSVGVVVVGRGIPRTFLQALAAGELLLVLGALLGGLLMLTERLRQPGLHLAYTLLAVLIVPVALGYTRGRSSRWDAAVLVVACLAVLVVLRRSAQTGAAG